MARMLAARDPDTGQPMSDERIADNLATFLLAGHETTAKALTWTLYILARAPEWQERVREEVLAAAGTGPVGAATIAKLPLTSRVLKESMRLYPPVPVMTRVTTEDVEIGGIKHLPNPTLIVIPIYAVHRHRSSVDRPRSVRPRPLSARERGQIPAHAVHAVRLRTARLHRVVVRHPRGDGNSCHFVAKRPI